MRKVQVPYTTIPYGNLHLLKFFISRNLSFLLTVYDSGTGMFLRNGTSMVPKVVHIILHRSGTVGPYSTCTCTDRGLFLNS